MADEELSVQITAIDRASEVFRGLSKGSDDLLQTITSLLTPARLLGGLFGYELVSGLKDCLDGFTKLAMQVRDLSYLSGGSAQQVSILVNGMEALGVSTDTVERGMNMMSRAIEAGSPALNKLGISVADSSGKQKNALTIFYETVDALGQMTNETQRNAIARELFGRGWTDLVPILSMGSEKLREIGAASGKVISADDIERARSYKLALHDLNEIWETFKTNTGRELNVPITFVVKWTGQLLGGSQSNSWQPSGMSLEDAQKLLMGGMGLKSSTSPAGSAPDSLAYYAAEALSMEGLSGGKTAATVQQLQWNMYSAQTTLMQAQARALLATSPNDVLKAQSDVVRAQLGAELAKAALEQQKNPESDPMYNARVAAIKAQSGDAIAKLARVNIDQTSAAFSKTLVDNTAAEASDLANNPPPSGITGEANIAAWQQAADFPALQTFEYIRKGWEETGKFITNASEDAEAHITQVSAWTADEILKTDANAYRQRVQSMQQDVQDFVDSEAKKTGLYNNQDNLRRDEAIAWYDWTERQRQIEIQREKSELLIRMGASQDYFDKVGLALQYHVTDWRTADQRILDITKQFADAAQRTLSEVYFDVVTGKFSDLTKVVENFGLALLRIGTDELAKSTMSWLFGGGNGGSGGSTGGGAPSLTSLLGLANTGANVATAASGGTGSGSAILSALPFGGILTGIDKLAGGTISGYLSSLFGGVSSFPQSGALFNALSESTAEFSDLGLQSATTLSNTGLAGGGADALAGGGDVLVGEAGTATGEAATEAGAGLLGGLSLPLAGIGAVLSAGLAGYFGGQAQTAQEAALNNALGQSADSWFAMHPDIAAAIIADPMNPNNYVAEFGAVGSGGLGIERNGQLALPSSGADIIRAKLLALGMPDVLGYDQEEGWIREQWSRQGLETQASQWRVIDPSGYWGGDPNANPNNVGGSDRASGGPVWPGWSGTVGEQGPERMTIGPGGYGFVTPNDGTPASGTGGSGGGDIHFHIDLRGATLTSGVPDQLIKQISAALPWRERYLRVRR